MSVYKNQNGVLLADDRINEIEQYEKVMFNQPNGMASKKPKFYTEVEFYNELGELTQKGHNEQLLSGGLFTLSKIAGVDMPINIKTINTDLSININETVKSFTGPRREDIIQGFMIGIDGCTDVFDTVSPVLKKQRNIKSLVPFRTVETVADLTTGEKAKYALKVQDGTRYKYFLKHFESVAIIKAEFDEPGNPTVPANVDESTSESVINSYVQFVLKINVNDVREFFKLEGGGLRKARVNTLGLVTGYPEGGDLKGCRMFSRINFNNEAFDNETKELTIVYKIYI